MFPILYLRGESSMKKIFFLTMFMIMFVSVSFAADTKIVTFEWDASPQGTVIGYNIYQTTVSGEYTQPALNNEPITNTTYQYTIQLPLDLTLYFVLKATNGVLESNKSNEVTLEQPSAPTLGIRNYIKIENSDVTINNN